MFDYYQLTVPVYTRALKQLSHLLDKAADYAAAKKVSDETMLALRLAPDMYSLGKQVQVVCDFSKLAVARLSGTQAPKHEDNEKSFAELQARIAATRRYIDSLPQGAFVDAEKKTITLPFMPDQPMTAEFYLLSFVQPNVYFHLTAIYAILRSNGVEVGKSDFLGAM